MSIVCSNISCKKEYKYFSELKKHLKISNDCSKDINDIEQYILELKIFTVKKN